MKKDPTDVAADRILALMPVYHRYFLRTTAEVSGITIAQYRALGMLMKRGPLSMTELGGQLFISKPSMTILADSLVENGWVRRQNDPDDRRITRIQITPQGKRHLQQAFAIFRADVRNRISRLDPRDIRELSAALGDLERIFAKLEG